MAVVVALTVFVADLLFDIDGGMRGGLRIVVIVAAIAVAGTFYQRWSTVPARAVPHHAMAALGLIGGALVASSAFSVEPGVYGNQITALLGLSALVLAVIAARATLATSTGAPR